ncbi:hypothetical protein V866_002459 [Kwoniella sp. B9012]|uniref:Zn(2)-C6 fungal-type domain-containing protein n=1 Tax=Kwoniella europaea PYCC6329 TaxID=1423913 RepID=A0AAX4KE81_9TREE
MSVDDLGRLRRTNEERTESSPGENKRRRKLNHVTKACDACRLRKTKCDGTSTRCGACVDKGLSCTYEKVDGRKTRQRQGNIRDKLDNLTNLLLASQTVANFVASQRPQHQSQQQSHLPSLSPPQTRPPPSAFSLPSVPPDRHPPPTIFSELIGLAAT